MHAEAWAAQQKEVQKAAREHAQKSTAGRLPAGVQKADVQQQRRILDQEASCGTKRGAQPQGKRRPSKKHKTGAADDVCLPFCRSCTQTLLLQTRAQVIGMLQAALPMCAVDLMRVSRLKLHRIYEGIVMLWSTLQVGTPNLPRVQVGTPSQSKSVPRICRVTLSPTDV
jgi:hypothetical protein